jgi:flavin-binding protein dodecin
MSVLKVIEILANSNVSWEDATQNAVTHASKTIKNIRSVNIGNQSATVADGKIEEYRVNVKISLQI